jgi:hypothetical protein
VARTEAAGTGCLLRALRAYLAFVLIVATLSVGLGYAAASRAHRVAERAWAERAESMQAFASRFPKQPDSPAALALDRLTRPLGIQMTPLRGTKARDDSRDKLLSALGTALSGCGRSGTDDCAVPPESVAYLDREAVRIDAVERHILEGGPILWEQDIDKGVGAPVPALLGERYLQSVLLGRALLQTQRGATEAAERSLEASLLLDAAYAERPELISRLIALAAAGMRHAVLRAIRQPSDRWREQLQRRTLFTDVWTPFQFEAWSWTRYSVGLWGIFDLDRMQDGREPARTMAGTVGRLLTAPYVRLCFAAASGVLLRSSEELARQRRCDFDVERFSKEVEASFASWNVLGRTAIPAVVRAFVSMRHGDLDRELTERVLQARAERRATGRWPTRPVASSVCEGVVWEAQTGADGSTRIRPSEPPFPAHDPKGEWSIRLRP